MKSIALTSCSDLCRHARRVAQLSVAPDLVLVDGNKPIPDLWLPQQTIVGGDGKVVAIACASIVAKVSRDRMMLDYHQQYPQYGFDRHKGYPTPEHRRMIERHGALDIHRKSFTLLANQQDLDLPDRSTNRAGRGRGYEQIALDYLRSGGYDIIAAIIVTAA